MNEVKVRLESYIRYKGVSVREFERNAKLSVGFVRNIRQNISPTKQKAIRSAYPELNVGWLLTGDGEMLIDKMPDSVSNSGIKEEESIKQRFKEYAIYRNLFFSEALSKIPPDIDIQVRLSMSVSDRIADILSKKGLTQKELAKGMGKTEAEVSRWLGGTHNFTLSTIAKISAYLKEDILTTPAE